MLTAIQSYDDEGEPVTSVAKLLPDGRIPHYRVLGLIDFVHAGMRADIGMSEEPDS